MIYLLILLCMIFEGNQRSSIAAFLEGDINRLLFVPVEKRPYEVLRGRLVGFKNRLALSLLRFHEISQGRKFGGKIRMNWRCFLRVVLDFTETALDIILRWPKNLRLFKSR